MNSVSLPLFSVWPIDKIIHIYNGKKIVEELHFSTLSDEEYLDEDLDGDLLELLEEEPIQFAFVCKKSKFLMKVFLSSLRNFSAVHHPFCRRFSQQQPDAATKVQPKFYKVLLPFF